MSKRAITKALVPLMVASSMLNSTDYSEKEIEDNGKIALKYRSGYEHKGKTQERLDARRERRKKLKIKRNAKKGIYTRKITYKKNKGNN